MRLTGVGSPPNLGATVARARPLLDAWVARGRAGLERARPYWERLAGEIRKHPKLAAGIKSAADAWTRLVASFCETIDPYLARYFPDIRLVAVTTESGDVELHETIKGATTPRGPLSAISPDERAEIERIKWTAVELRLRPDQVLRRTLALPAASRDFLAPIIEHKLERLTPWRPDRVLYGYQILDGTETGAVTVALTATSKDLVAAPLKALGEIGLVPTAIGAEDGPLTSPLRVNLFKGAPKAARVDSRRMVSRVALMTFAILGLSYLASSLWSAGAADALDQAGVRLMKARRLLKTASMGAVGERERVLLEAKQPQRAIVVLIDKLAAVIPQDTYLKELAVTPDKIRIVGLSGNSPALVGELEGVGLLNVRFTSAVTREKDRRDSFEITADRVAPAADTP